MPIVAMPDGAQVQFPDEMQPDQIKSLILQKFPQLSNPAEVESLANAPANRKYLGDLVSNIPGSAVELAKNTIQPILHPIDTAEGVYNLGKGVLQKFGIVSGDDAEKHADAVGQFFKDRYGSAENIAKTIKEDPVGVLADLSTVLTAGGTAAARVPGAVGKVGNVVSKIGDATNPLIAAGKAAELGGKGLAVVGDALTQTGYANIVKSAEAGGKGVTSAESNAFWSNLAKREPMENVVKQAQDALASLKADAGSEYRSGMIPVKNDKTVLSFKDIDSAVTKMNGVKTFKGIELSEDTKAVRDRIQDKINDWKRLDPAEYHTPEGIDALKQAIGGIKDEQQFGSPSRVVADQIYNSVRQTIAKQSPTYDKVMKGYAEAQQEVAKISKELSLGNKVNPGTALRKLQSVMRDGVNTSFGYRRQLMDKLVDAGAETLPYAVAGQQMGAVLPRGVVGRALTGAAALSLGGEGAAHAMGAVVPHMGGLGAYGLAALPFMSPAVTGTTAYTIGAANRYLNHPRSGLATNQLGRLPLQ